MIILQCRALRIAYFNIYKTGNSQCTALYIAALWLLRKFSTQTIFQTSFPSLIRGQWQVNPVEKQQPLGRRYFQGWSGTPPQRRSGCHNQIVKMWIFPPQLKSSWKSWWICWGGSKTRSGFLPQHSFSRKKTLCTLVHEQILPSCE